NNAYEQSVNLFGTLSVTGEETVGKELRLWGLRQRMRGLRAECSGSTSHILGTLLNRTVFHVSSEKISSATLRRGFVMAPNLFLHAVDDWKGPEEVGGKERLQIQTARHVYNICVERSNGEASADIAEDSCLEVLHELTLMTGQTRGHGVCLVLRRKPSTWKPPPIVRRPQSRTQEDFHERERRQQAEDFLQSRTPGPNETVTSFVEDVPQLRSRVDPQATEGKTLRFLMEGVKNDIFGGLVRHQPATVDEFVAEATNIDLALSVRASHYNRLAGTPVASTLAFP
ncbi:hypothetical protein HPB47_022552, partial [Ixodes persulcatus]